MEETKNINDVSTENKDVEDQTKEDTSGQSDKEVKSEDKKDSSAGKTFTQEQVNRMMAKEKNQGRNAVYNELGIDPKDTKTINMFKAFIESQKSDEQKNAEKESENANKMFEAELRAQTAEAKAEAMMLGVKPQFVEDVVTLALAKMTDDSDLKTIIGEFKTKYPTWFGDSDKEDDKEKKEKTGQKGTGSSIKSSEKDKKGEEKKGIGARLAAQRKSGNKKSNYWNR